jgi:hypothetical protein
MVDRRLTGMTNPRMQDIYALKDSVTQSIGIRNQIIINENQHTRAELSIQQQHLHNQLSVNRFTMYAQGSGIVSPFIDGWERIFTFANVTQLTREQTRTRVDYNTVLPQREATEDEPVFKIVNSNDWFVAAFLPNEEVAGIRVGETRTIYIEGPAGFTPVSMRVHHVDAGFVETFVVYRSTRHMLDFLNMRSVRIQTTESMQQGYKINNSAISTRSYFRIPELCVYETEEYQYVLKLQGLEDVKVPVRIFDNTQGFAYISTETEGLLVDDALRERENPMATHTVLNHQYIRGVYKVVNGIAVFQRITLPDDAAGTGTTGGFTIINPSDNPGLRVFDHIVSDASLVAEGQIVFQRVR